MFGNRKWFSENVDIYGTFWSWPGRGRVSWKPNPMRTQDKANLACSRLSVRRDGANIRKGTRKWDARYLGKKGEGKTPTRFPARFLNSRFPHYLGVWNRLKLIQRDDSVANDHQCEQYKVVELPFSSAVLNLSTVLFREFFWPFFFYRGTDQ